jgi:hypothetical protein
MACPLADTKALPPEMSRMTPGDHRAACHCNSIQTKV